MRKECVKMHSNKDICPICLVLIMMPLCCRVKGRLRFVRLHCCRARNGMPRLKVNFRILLPGGGLPYQIYIK